MLIMSIISAIALVIIAFVQIVHNWESIEKFFETPDPPIRTMYMDRYGKIYDLSTDDTVWIIGPREENYKLIWLSRADKKCYNLDSQLQVVPLSQHESIKWIVASVSDEITYSDKVKRARQIIVDYLDPHFTGLTTG